MNTYHNFLANNRLDRVIDATAAGTSDVNSASVDMAVGSGYSGVVFSVLFGALTATQVTKIKVQGSHDNSAWSDLAGTESPALADGDSNKQLVVDVFRPAYRYVRCVVDRGTANAVIDAGLAILYGAKVQPATQAADVVSAEVHVSPAAGTA